MNINYKSIEAVLFDLDGTLLDTANDLGETLNYLLKKYDFPLIPAEKYRPVASDGAKGLLELGFKEALSQFDYETLRQEFLTHYQTNIAQYTCLYPGVSEFLNQLNEHKIPWGVVTNKPEGLTRLLLPYFKEFKQCGVLIGGDTLATRKPDPEPLIHACQHLNVKPNKCLYIGDALRDIEAGNSAQMTTIIAQWGYIKATDNISLWKADHIAEKVNDCLVFI